jgi:hypothetical protein
MKIITFNLRRGGPPDPNWSWVMPAFQPDILLAQESRSPPAPLLPRSSWRAIQGSTWGSAVYVRSGQVRPLALRQFRGWLAGLEVQGFPFPPLAGRPLRVFSLHAPPRRIMGTTYIEAVRKMLDVIWANRGDGDLIIGGDFNVTVGVHHPAERNGRGSWVNQAAELRMLERLRGQFGLVNCWQAANPGVPLHQTLRWSNDPVPSYHCDGIFVPASWQVRLSCTVVDREEWAGLSDHNPVVATFGAGGG